ncbi:hypothetical protein JW979_11215 [bacterium]|nr:hypothetical protein [candidate division CSSED10-310 bacterium]
MKATASILILVAAVTVCFWILFGVYIPEGFKAVRYNHYGDASGLQNYVLTHGFTWRLPFLSEVQILPVEPQTFILRNDRPEGPNPNRSALYMKTDKSFTRKNIIISYYVDPEQVLLYADAFFRIPSKIVIEGYMRDLALNRTYNGLTEFKNDVDNKCGIFGLRINSIEDQDMKFREQEQRAEEKRKMEMKAKHRKVQTIDTKEAISGKGITGAKQRHSSKEAQRKK